MELPVKTKKERKYSWHNVRRDLSKNKIIYLMVLPLILFFIIFHYLPMGGLLIAFENYKPKLGIFGSHWVGLENFKDFFTSIFAVRTIRNTIVLSLQDLVIAFPFTIIFALLINEVSNKWFKKTVQTITYMPYFISLVVLAGILVDFTSTNGVIAQAVSVFTGKSANLLGQPGAWRPLYILSGLWQMLGFGSIIYIAALSGVEQQLYEAAVIDGAGRFSQTWHVTLPGISTTIIIMLILRIGMLMAIGYEKTILLYNPQIYETADIVSSYVYRKGLQEFNYGYSTAVSLFNSVINFTLLLAANSLARKISDTSLF